MAKTTNSLISEDIEQVISDGKLPWVMMKDSSVLVTGATGLLGSALVRTLRAASDRRGLNLNIIATGRNRDKIALLTDNCGADCAFSADIRKPLPIEMLPERVDYIFHCAAITKSSQMAATPVDVITTAVDGTRNVLEVAKDRKCRGFVYLSSMEVYGQSDKPEVLETDFGLIDLSEPRSCYPESKRLCESLCIAYAAQHGVPSKIARLAQTFGAGTPLDDGRVFGQFARSILEGRDIVLHTEGKSRGNYCYLSDAISGLLYVLLKGNSFEAYNVANPQASATIREMAELAAGDIVGEHYPPIEAISDCGEKINIKVDIRKDRAKHGYPPDTGYVLNADKLMALGWKPRYALAEMYRRMLGDWRGQESRDAQDGCDTQDGYDAQDDCEPPYGLLETYGSFGAAIYEFTKKQVLTDEVSGI